MADVNRLVELGMVPELAAEVAAQIDAAAADLAPVVAAVQSPAAYSDTPADIAAALAAAGLMQPDA